MPGVFGVRVGAYDVELAVLAVLQARLPTYIDRRARDRGIDPEAAGFPIRPRSLLVRKDFGGWPETRLPCVQVVCPGMADPPAREDGEGLYTLNWQVNVFCVLSARDHAATRVLRSVYEDAIAWCLLQHRSLGGLASGMDWLGESSADVTVEEADNRTLQGSVIVLSVEVRGCLDPLAGPAAFIDDVPGTDTYPAPYDDDTIAEEVLLDVQPEDDLT